MKTLQQHIEEAFACHRAGDLTKAESIYDQLLGQITAPEPNIFFGYGTLLVAQQKYGLGIALIQAALNITPDHTRAPLWTNLGCAYKHLGRDEAALDAYEKALALEPNQADILAGVAGFWINKNEPQKVVDYARKALALDPNHPAGHMHLGLGLLEQGKYTEAWPHYEYRWDTPERIKDKRPYKAPVWKGEKVKTLAIHGEQGLGDEILFMSCLNKVRLLADEIIIECADRLVETFKDSFGLPCYKDHQSLIATHGEPDAYIAMASLPMIVGLPDGKPFLKRNRTHKGKMPRVGYTWKGGTLRTNIKDRTIKKEDLDPITSIPGIEFVSVQYGEGDSFEELQQKIADCDLVISVCQTAVHQAGAMGVDCWVLVPKKSSWAFSAPSMPWYNSVKFFRQEVAGEWELPIQMIAASLKERYADLAA